MIDQVRKTLPLDGHAQLFHVREVRRSQPTWRMLLREEHLPGRTLGGTPHLHPPLQRAHLPVLKATGILSLQELEHRLGLKPGVVLKQLLHIIPDIDERIGPCPTAHRRSATRWATRHGGDTSAPSSASIPALDAAISWFSSVFINANNLRTCLSVTNPPPLR